MSTYSEVKAALDDISKTITSANVYKTGGGFTLSRL